MTKPDEAPEHGFKVLTHDYRPPIQGGPAIWDGETLPHTLPKVTLDTSDVDCGRGWNYTETLADAFRISGLWPNGRPSCALIGSASDDRIRRGDKLRCSQLKITGRVEPAGVRAAILELSTDRFRMEEHAEQMTDSQLGWREALGRPLHDDTVVERELQTALTARELDWTLQRYDSARDAWDAWGAWGAWDARDALMVEYTSLRGWFDRPADHLTAGLREAYRHGLAIAIPTSKGVLGWAMV